MNLLDFIYGRVFYGYNEVYLTVFEKYTSQSERRIALKSIRHLCRKCSFNIMDDIKEIIGGSKDLKEFLVYIKLAVELGQLRINPTYSVRSIKKIRATKLLNDTEMDDLCELIFSLTILLLKCPSLIENVLEYKLPTIFVETKSIDIFRQFGQIISNCNDLVFSLDDYRYIIDNIVASIHLLKNLQDQVMILSLFNRIIVFAKEYKTLTGCSLNGSYLGGFVWSVADASKSINLVEFNDFVLPKFFYVLKTMRRLDMALKACKTNKFVEAFNYYKRDGDFRIIFKEKTYEDYGELRWRYELIINSK